MKHQNNPQVLNIWQGFQIDKVQADSSNNIEPFLMFTKALVGDRDPNDLLKWLAHLIQTPDYFCKQGLLFLGNPDIHDAYWEGFSKLIGENHCSIRELLDPKLFKKTFEKKDQYGLLPKHVLLMQFDHINNLVSYKKIIKEILRLKKIKYSKSIVVSEYTRCVFNTNNPKYIEEPNKYTITFTTQDTPNINTQHITEYFNDLRNQKAIIKYILSIKTKKRLKQIPSNNHYC